MNFNKNAEIDRLEDFKKLNDDPIEKNRTLVQEIDKLLEKAKAAEERIQSQKPVDKLDDAESRIFPRYL